MFANGWTLEAAEAVCSDQEGKEAELSIFSTEILDLLTHLVDKSMVLLEEKERLARYRLLETIRQYAGKRLEESEGAEMVRQNHARFFLALAERAELELHGPDQLIWLGRLESEHDNFLAALQCFREQANVQSALRLTGMVLRSFGRLAMSNYGIGKDADTSVKGMSGRRKLLR